MEPSERRLSQETVFDILSSPRRRYVLHYLRRAEEPVELTELAKQVAAWENETDPESLTDQQRKRVYVSLYQTHIPKLDDAGVVDYDSDEGTISLAPGATAVDDYLTQPEDGTPWQAIYFTEAVLGGVLLLLAIYDVSVFAFVTEGVLALVLVTVFAATTVVQYVVQRRRRSVPPELSRRT